MGISGKVVMKLHKVESSTRFEKVAEKKKKDSRVANLENILLFIKPKSIELSPRFVMLYKSQKNKKIGLAN